MTTFKTKKDVWWYDKPCRHTVTKHTQCPKRLTVKVSAFSRIESRIIRVLLLYIVTSQLVLFC